MGVGAEDYDASRLDDRRETLQRPRFPLGRVPANNQAVGKRPAAVFGDIKNPASAFRRAVRAWTQPMRNQLSKLVMVPAIIVQSIAALTRRTGFIR